MEGVLSCLSAGTDAQRRFSMDRKSAGLLMYRMRDGQAEVLLIHPGGPFWARKEEGAWSIPKGEFANEDPLAS